MSRALAELTQQCDDLSEKIKTISMANSGPHNYPSVLGPMVGVSPMMTTEHCPHCKHFKTLQLAGNIMFTHLCQENDCLCMLDHVRDCACHGDYIKWCDGKEIWEWLNGLTDKPTPLILTRVIS